MAIVIIKAWPLSISFTKADCDVECSRVGSSLHIGILSCRCRGVSSGFLLHEGDEGGGERGGGGAAGLLKEEGC